MKKPYLVSLILILLISISGCVTENIDPNTLKSQDEKALYDLMVARGRAINARDMNLFIQIYTKDSPELEWIENEGIPGWERNGMKYKDPSLKRVSVIGNDAAATFVVKGNNRSGTPFSFRVETLYVKEKDQWKIESTGQR